MPSTIDQCNPLSIRIFKKKYKDEILDGGPVLCKTIDKQLKIKRNKNEANWILSKSSIVYIHPQSLTTKEFSFNNWGVSSSLGLSKYKKIKGLSCIRIFKVDHPINDRILIHETFKKNKNKEYFDFYVEIGSEINISTVNSIFLDNLKA